MGGGVCIGSHAAGCGSIRIGEDEDWDLREPGVEFGDEGGPTNALHGVGGDDESQSVSELRLLDDAQGLRCVGYSDNVFELALEN